MSHMILVCYPTLSTLLVMLTESTDKGPIVLSDWFHRDYLSIVTDVVGTDVTKVVS